MYADRIDDPYVIVNNLHKICLPYQYIFYMYGEYV